jgi:sigma-B regulation protein RsbU (phosphoserine phosphatase)
MIMNHLHTLYLRFSTRLYLWTTPVILLIFGAIAVVFHAYGIEREEELGVSHAGFMLNDMTHSINNRLIAVENVVKRYEPLVVENLDSPDSLITILQDWALSDTLVVGGCIGFEPYYYPEKGKYFMPYVTRTLGNKTVSKYLGGADYDYFNMEWYRVAVTAGHGVWSEPFYDDGGGDVMMISYVLPIRDDSDRIVGAMTADMSIDELVRDIVKLRPYKDCFTFVLSRRGKFISHPRRSVILNQNIFTYADSLNSDAMRHLGNDMLRGTTGYDRRMLRGRDYLVNYTTLPRTGWSVANFSPYSEVVKNFSEINGYMIAILLAGLVVLLIMITYVIRRVTRSLNNLTRVAYDIAHGDFNAKLPHEPSDGSVRTLIEAFAHMQKSLAKHVDCLMHSTRAQERIQSELDIAHVIRTKTMPRTFPTSAAGEHIDVYAMLTPAGSAGGDFYDFMTVDGKLHFCIGTVTCTGTVATSLLVTVVRSVFRSVATERNPLMTVKSMNDVLRDTPETNVKASAFVGVLDLGSGELTYANATSNAPITVLCNGVADFLPDNPATDSNDSACDGELPDDSVFESCTLASTRLLHGMRMLLYTDGVINASNGGGTPFTDDMLCHTVNIIMANNPDISSQELLGSIDRSLAEHIDGAAQSSDRTLLTFTYKAY